MYKDVKLDDEKITKKKKLEWELIKRLKPIMPL